jgi:LmbE family N-acetylglucosaminyl deacetylase
VIPILLLTLLAPAALRAQLEPPSTGGYLALDLDLRRLGHYKRVLVIGAHPDDEDTELLTILVRGMGTDAAYLSLNRGEGGQNLIGDELGEALGLLRSEELLAARRLDGARQFFTRTYDFGFSKTLEDTWRHWPRDSVLKDVVRIVRRFRPQVVVSIFSGTPRDGHGQHQAAGKCAIEAFAIAGDSTRFPELAAEEGLQPWAPLKLYRSARFDTAATTLTLDGGVLDAVVGKSYHQIAMAGRSLHRSQDMGQLQRLGPSPVRLALLVDRAGGPGGGGGLFDGIDTALAATPWARSLAGDQRQAVSALLRRYTARVDSARRELSPAGAVSVRQVLERALMDLDSARGIAGPQPAGGEIRRVAPSPVLVGDPFEGELDRLGEALVRSAALVVDGISDGPRVIPGASLGVAASLWNGGKEAVPAALCVGTLRMGWQLMAESGSATGIPQSSRGGACLGFDASSGRFVSLSQAHDSLPAGRFVTARLQAAIPEGAPYTTPYFLRAPRDGDLYRWDPESRSSWGMPFEPPAFWVETSLSIGEWLAREVKEVTYRDNDQASGEYRLPVTVVPRVDVRLEPENEVWALASRVPRTFTVTLVHGARDTTAGVVELRLPAGWAPVRAAPFRFTREDEHATVSFTLRPPAGLRAGQYEIAAVARDQAGRSYQVGLRTVSHPHIHSRSYVLPAGATVHAADLVVPALRHVAYLRGAADHVPEALGSVGVPLEFIDGAALDRQDLRRYDVIVVGPRAYETDPNLPANTPALLDYARRGGVVLVQYQQYGFLSGRYAPYPLSVARPAERVTDETAPVRILDPASPVVRRPNRLGPADWEGWVQERGLYFPHTWDAAYRPLLEMNDPGEEPLRGSLLVARVGRGTWIYTGLSFFRQLPAGVPGAFRLFANLLALGQGMQSGPH